MPRRPSEPDLSAAQARALDAAWDRAGDAIRRLPPSRRRAPPERTPPPVAQRQSVGYSSDMQPTQYSHDAFLTHIRANPTDQTARAVYADWLEEHAPGTAGPRTLHALRTHQGPMWVVPHPAGGIVALPHPDSHLHPASGFEDESDPHFECHSQYKPDGTVVLAGLSPDDGRSYGATVFATPDDRDYGRASGVRHQSPDFQTPQELWHHLTAAGHVTVPADPPPAYVQQANPQE